MTVPRALVILTALAAPSACWAQGGKVEGVVKSEGHPVEGMTVLLKGNSDNNLASHVTKDDGKYLFKDLPDGGTVDVVFQWKDRRVVTVMGLPTRGDHVLNPVLTSHHALSYTADNFAAVGRDTSRGYEIYRAFSPDGDAPAWALAGAGWLAKADPAIRRKPAAAGLDLNDFNRLAVSLYETRAAAALATNLGQAGLSVQTLSARVGTLTLDKQPAWVVYFQGDEVKGFATDGKRREKNFTLKHDTLDTFQSFIKLASSGAEGPAVALSSPDEAFVYEHAFEFKARRVEKPARSKLLAVSPDGKTTALLAADGAEVRLTRGVADRGPTLSTGPDAVLVARFSPDGKLLATGTALGTLAVWDVAAGTRLFREDLGQPFVNAIEFLARGDRLAVGTGLARDGGAVRLFQRSGPGWKMSDRKEMPFDVIDLTVSPDGRKLIAIPGGAHDPVRFDVADGSLRSPLTLKAGGRPVFVDSGEVGVLTWYAGEIRQTVLPK